MALKESVLEKCILAPRTLILSSDTSPREGENPNPSAVVIGDAPAAIKSGAAVEVASFPDRLSREDVNPNAAIILNEDGNASVKGKKDSLKILFNNVTKRPLSPKRRFDLYGKCKSTSPNTSPRKKLNFTAAPSATEVKNAPVRANTSKITKGKKVTFADSKSLREEMNSNVALTLNVDGKAEPDIVKLFDDVNKIIASQLQIHEKYPTTPTKTSPCGEMNPIAALTSNNVENDCGKSLPASLANISTKTTSMASPNKSPRFKKHNLTTTDVSLRWKTCNKSVSQMKAKLNLKKNSKSPLSKTQNKAIKRKVSTPTFKIINRRSIDTCKEKRDQQNRINRRNNLARNFMSEVKKLSQQQSEFLKFINSLRKEDPSLLVKRDFRLVGMVYNNKFQFLTIEEDLMLLPKDLSTETLSDLRRLIIKCLQKSQLEMASEQTANPMNEFNEDEFYEQIAKIDEKLADDIKKNIDNCLQEIDKMFKHASKRYEADAQQTNNKFEDLLQRLVELECKLSMTQKDNAKDKFIIAANYITKLENTNEANKELEKLKNQISDLENKLDAQTEVLESKALAIESRNLEIKTLNSKVKKLESTKHQLTRELGDNKKKLHSYKISMKNDSDIKNNLEENLKETSASYIEIQSAFMNDKDLNKKLSDKLEDTINQLNSYKSNVETQLSTISDLEINVNLKDLDIKSLQTENTQYKTTNSSLNEEIEILNNKLESMKNSEIKVIPSKDAESVHCEGEQNQKAHLLKVFNDIHVENLKGKLSDLERVVKSLTAKLNKAENKIDKQYEELNKRTNSQNENKQQIEILTYKDKEKTSLIEKLNSQLSNAKQQFIDYDTQLRDMAMKLNWQTKAVEKYEAKLERRNEEIKDLKEKIKKKEDVNIIFKNDVVTHKDERRDDIKVLYRTKHFKVDNDESDT